MFTQATNVFLLDESDQQMGLLSCTPLCTSLKTSRASHSHRERCVLIAGRCVFQAVNCEHPHEIREVAHFPAETYGDSVSDRNDPALFCERSLLTCHG
jgi:hypothetical protein